MSELDQCTLLSSQAKPDRINNSFGWAFLTTFSTQYYWINRLLKKHWKVLKGDRILGPVLPDQPKVMFCRSQILRNDLAPNIVDLPPKPNTFRNLTVFFPVEGERYAEIPKLCAPLPLVPLTQIKSIR